MGSHRPLLVAPLLLSLATAATAQSLPPAGAIHPFIPLGVRPFMPIEVLHERLLDLDFVPGFFRRGSADLPCDWYWQEGPLRAEVRVPPPCAEGQPVRGLSYRQWGEADLDALPAPRDMLASWFYRAGAPRQPEDCRYIDAPEGGQGVRCLWDTPAPPRIARSSAEYLRYPDGRIALEVNVTFMTLAERQARLRQLSREAREADEE